MPIRICSVCNQLQKYSKSDYKYLDKDGPMVCSVQCILDWLIDVEDDRSDPLDIDPGDERHCGIVNMDRPNEVYSHRLKMWFRSHFEMHVAEVLDDSDFKFQYEKIGFTWNRKIYTPDLYFPSYLSFIEVKGKWQASQRSKYADFREVWPEIRLLVVPWTLESEFREFKEILG